MDNKLITIPYIAFEGELARQERYIKRLAVVLAISVVLIFISNALWLYAWCQYDYSSEDVTVNSDGGGNANYIGRNGDINNGISESKTQEEDQERV